MTVATDYRTVPEIARELRVSERTIYRAVERGELPAIRLGGGGRLRIPLDALEEFLHPAVKGDAPLDEDRA